MQDSAGALDDYDLYALNCSTPGCDRPATDVVPGGGPICEPCARHVAGLIRHRAKKARRARRAAEKRAVPRSKR